MSDWLRRFGRRWYADRFSAGCCGNACRCARFHAKALGLTQDTIRAEGPYITTCYGAPDQDTHGSIRISYTVSQTDIPVI